ncbi:hypothetical protein [Amycolatopsis alkalitolerans]|uniref:Uncharacterized protein n=1 Tax=Amycolatopsis alkalitolerans TaxID=2547244 RepID=A0A5C4MCE1_9PSEU|nr:hypothetical protein [Amycolatopsis alkalitolerans]TNC29701.1 hypothetical protein FG385_01755 [Amycolatopsis alkalitolerans]
MTNLIIFIAALALLGYAIERNHRRQRPGRMNGSVNFEDRDRERIAEEFRAAPRSPRPAPSPDSGQAPHDVGAWLVSGGA